LIRLAVRVRRTDAELVLAELLELAPSGVEEVDVDPEQIEYVIYGAPGELPALPSLRALAGGALVDLSTTEIADDWADRWRQFHRPLVLGERLTVRPPWEPPGQTAIDLVIDPGRAFGTGAHATTRVCLELLLELTPPGVGGVSPGSATPPHDWAAVDLGCGSGVLSIAAAALGWRPVLALDYDPLSVDAASANAVVNGVELHVRRHDLRESDTPAADLVLANLLAPLLVSWIERLRAAPELIADVVIASGLLATEADEIAAEFATIGLLEQRRMCSGEWAALLLARK
jgi:ribosomal protein L11 methyltransferase